MDDKRARSGGAPRRRRSLGIGAGLSALALVVPLVWGSGALPVEVPFVDGIAWLANDRGDVVRVNGQTGTVDARLDLEGAEEIAVTQNEGVALVQVGDEIRQIDLAGLDWGESIAADGELVVGRGPDDGLVYLVTPEGMARRLDPETLAVQSEVDLDGEPGLGVVAGGRLVVPVKTDEAVTVRVVEDDRSVGDVEVGDVGDRVRVSRVGDDVAVVNLADDTVRTLDPTRSDIRAGDAIELDLPAGEILVPAELPDGPLWLMAVRAGDLVAVDLDSGDTRAVVGVTAGRNDVVGPVALEDRVYLVDRDARVIIEIDVDAMAEQARYPLDLDDAGRVEILVEDGRVFVNDRSGSYAVVLAPGEEPRVVDKYSDEGLTSPMPPSDLVRETDEPDDGGDADGDADRPEDRQDPQADPVPSEPAVPVGPPPPAPDPVPEAPSDPPAPPPPPSPPDVDPPQPAVAEPPPPPPTTTTTTTTTAPPPPPAEPPGAIQLTPAAGDQRVDLSWSGAASGSPVTYHIASNRAVGGQTSWTTGDLSRAFTGLTNGTSYEFTVTPSNEGGNGPTARATVVPLGAPVVSGPAVNAVGDRDLEVTFSYSANGGELRGCRVAQSGQAPIDAACEGGTGRATFTVADYNTSYSFTATVENQVGADSASTSGTSGAKPLTVDGSQSRWEGSCYWPALGTSRPIHSSPVNACIDSGADDYIGTAANGSTQRVLCYRHDVSIRDDSSTSSDVWVQLTGGGWMSALYFTNWTAAHQNLPTC